VRFTPFGTALFTSATDVVYINVEQSSVPPPPPPPSSALGTVTAVGLETARVKKKTATDIVISLSGAIEAVDADNLANHHLAAPGKGKKSKTYSKVIHLSSAAYNAATHQVTLLVHGKLALNRPPQLRITASGMLDALGRPLDGNHDGQPGGDYVAFLTTSGARPQIVIGTVTLARRPPPRFLTRAQTTQDFVPGK